MNARKILEGHALDTAKIILGSHLIYKDKIIRIVEVEAYRGSDDRGSHATKGPTPRNQIMYGPPGFTYIYLNYGIHWLLNIVVEPENNPAAILIRAGIPINGFNEDTKLNGPAILTKNMGINKSLHGIDVLNKNSPLKLELNTGKKNIIRTTRVGLSAGKGDTLPWRFIDKDQLYTINKQTLRNYYE